MHLLVVMEPAPNLLMILRLALATTAIRLPRESTSTRTIAYGSTAAHADIAAAYGPERARYCGIGSDGSAGGLGVGATDHFSRYSGGGDDIGLQDSDLGAGGKSIGG